MSLQTLSFPSGLWMEGTGELLDIGALPEAITAPRTDAVYNCHAYLTKVPISAIRPFIETFSSPGETVGDFFAGSGMTGLAAITMGRNAALSDISVLGRHIANGYLARVSTSALRGAAVTVIDQVRTRIGLLYSTQRVCDGAVLELTRTIWSFTYICPACRKKMVYYEHLSPEGKQPKACPSCGGVFERRKWPRGEDVPVEVVVVGQDGKLGTQPVCQFDLNMIAMAAEDDRQREVPSLAIGQDREMYSRSGLGKAGLVQTSLFFSPRNSIALLELWRGIDGVVDDRVRQKLRFAFTAILPRASRRYQWSPQRPLNAQNQTYYIAPVYYEWNVFELFNRKVEASVRADEELHGPDGAYSAGSTATYELASADQLAHLSDESLDYVFTDPPFGSNIFYSDMSLFHEAWIGEITDNQREAVIHTTGKRKNGAEDRYEKLLRNAFAEAFRVLKKGRHMSVVFGNSSGRVWGLVQRALRDAGFTAPPIHVAILDKGQRSVKGLNSGSEAVVTVDLVLTVQKPVKFEFHGNARSATQDDATALIREAIEDLPAERARNPSYVYAHVLTKAIERHLPMDDFHLGDVLVALRRAGYSIDRKSGFLVKQKAELRAA